MKSMGGRPYNPISEESWAMPTDFIQVDSNAKYAGDLLRYKELFRSVVDLAEKLVDMMNHNTDGVDYSSLEGLYGVPLGSGDEVYNLVLGSRAALLGTAQSSDGMTLIGRVG